MAGRRGRRSQVGSTSDLSMEEQLALPIDLNKRRSFQYVPAKVSSKSKSRVSPVVAPATSWHSPSTTRSPDASHPSSKSVKHAASASSFFLRRRHPKGGDSSSPKPRSSKRRSKAHSTSSNGSRFSPHRRSKKQHARSPKHLSASHIWEDPFGDYGDESDEDDEDDDFDDDDTDYYDESDRSGRASALSTSRPRSANDFSRQQQQPRARRRRRRYRNWSYSRKLQMWRESGTSTFSARHHVRFPHRLEVPSTRLTPLAVSLLERSIFAHGNHPIIETMPVYPLPPVALDREGVAWNETSPPTMSPSSSGMVGWVTAMSSSSAAGRGQEQLVQSITFKQMEAPARSDGGDGGGGGGDGRVAVNGHGSGGSGGGVVAAELAETATDGDEDGASSDGDTFNVVSGGGGRNSVHPAAATSTTTASTTVSATSTTATRGATPSSPPPRPRSAWAESASPHQPRKTSGGRDGSGGGGGGGGGGDGGGQRSAQAAFGELEMTQGHNVEADTSVFVVDRPLSVLDRLRMLPSHMPMQVENERPRDVPAVEDGMTFFRLSALQYVFGDRAADPGQRDDTDFEFDADAVAAVYDEDLRSTTKPIGHHMLESVTEDVEVDIDKDEAPTASTTAAPAAVLLRRRSTRASAEAFGFASRPASISADDRRRSVASVYGFEFGGGESTDVDVPGQVRQRGNSISIAGLGSTAETDDHHPQQQQQQPMATTQEEEAPLSPLSDRSDSAFGFGFDELIDDLFFKSSDESSPASARAALRKHPRSVRLSRRLSAGDTSGDDTPATSPHRNTSTHAGHDSGRGGDGRGDGGDSDGGRGNGDGDGDGDRGRGGGGGGGGGVRGRWHSVEDETTDDDEGDGGRGYMSVLPEAEGADTDHDDDDGGDGGDGGDGDDGGEAKRRDTDAILGYGFTTAAAAKTTTTTMMGGVAVKTVEEEVQDAGEANASTAHEKVSRAGNLLLPAGDGDSNGGDGDGGGVRGKTRGGSIMRVVRNTNHAEELARINAHTDTAATNEPLTKEQEQKMADTVESLGDADDQYEQLHYLKELTSLLQEDSRLLQECIDCGGVVVLNDLAKNEAFVAVQIAAVDVMTILAQQHASCLELSDAGCVSTLKYLLEAYSVAESAARALVAIARHTIDIVVLTGVLPKLVAPMPRFDVQLIGDVVSLLYACRRNHAAALARAHAVDPLLTALPALTAAGDEESVLMALQVIAAIKARTPAVVAPLLKLPLADKALAPLKTHTNLRIRDAVSSLLA
ncbi:hypothetical protein PTSG_05915 [Salpingoeca rosetta]|uniref:Uncharacterized protein n=1 Tax=Salpingoeca rosetta (strain ATCC 50818 / BSB-021) TaxID=946362 RepID=F2UD56_SALR5|nr:uncharacterized protein PTSG_05915 [Salpingoeca rosetta]EGD74551.1 hypothetical protein PTSG_05915 [Salpingoeca rosetta]|eukprot:XP_004992808.1 hypothetical protein PTSG_05915 [Salpingoeca rosetta]